MFRCPRFLGCLLALFLANAACLPKLGIRESFRQAVELPVTQGAVALERGETLELDLLLKQENLRPEKVILTRLSGRYLLTAEGFRHVWMLEPSGRDQATYKALKLPDDGKILQPQFQHSIEHQCVTLVLGGTDKQTRWQIHASGEIARNCNDAVQK